MNNKPLIVILGNSSVNNISKYVWYETFTCNDVIYIPEVNKYNVSRKLYRVLFNRHTLGKIIFWDRLFYLVNHSFLSNFLVAKIPDEADIIICSNASLLKYNNFDKIDIHKKRRKSKVVLFLHDTLNKLTPNEVKTINDKINKNIIDLVYSFDSKDCETYGFKYVVQCYTPIALNPSNIISSDLYFGGRSKGRLPLLSSILVSAQNYKVKSLFRIPELNNKEKEMLLKTSPTIYHEKMLSYEETLKEMINCNCILEIVQDGQSGITWRTVEAFVYNKKLLTNNIQVIHNPYYNPKYIQVFTDVKDIDFEWVKSKEYISYGYKNDYSPLNLISKIKEDLGLVN